MTPSPTLTLSFYRQGEEPLVTAVASIEEAIQRAFLALDNQPSADGIPLEVRDAAGAVVMNQHELHFAAGEYAVTFWKSANERPN